MPSTALQRGLFRDLKIRHSVVGYIAHAASVAQVWKEGRRPLLRSLDWTVLFLNKFYILKNVCRQQLETKFFNPFYFFRKHKMQEIWDPFKKPSAQKSFAPLSNAHLLKVIIGASIIGAFRPRRGEKLAPSSCVSTFWSLKILKSSPKRSCIITYIESM